MPPNDADTANARTKAPHAGRNTASGRLAPWQWSSKAGCYFVAIQGSIRVGAKVQIAPNCAFYPYEHGIAVGRSIQQQPLRSKGDIEIGDDAWLATA